MGLWILLVVAVVWLWQRSSFCGTNACVEVLHVDGRVMVRNSGDAVGHLVEFSRAEWAAFLAGVRAGEFEVPRG